MKTCLSDDHPVVSLLLGLIWIVVGTWNLFLWYGEFFDEFGWMWIVLPMALVQYGLAAHFLRNGASHRSERLRRLFEPRW